MRGLLRDMRSGAGQSRGPSAPVKAAGYAGQARETHKLVVAEAVTTPRVKADRAHPKKRGVRAERP